MDNNQEKQTTQTNEQPISKPILVIGTTNKQVATYLKGYCTKKEIELVQMKEEELQAYLNKVDPKYKDSLQHKSLKAFIESKENRTEAFKQAVKLFTILMPKEGIEKAEDKVFTFTDVVRATTLSHSKFKSLFEMWELFNLVKRVDKNKFSFTFNKEQQRQNILDGIKSLTYAIVSDITRYNASIDSDDEVSDEEKKQARELLIKMIIEL